jgi:hypothetical protein
MSISDTDSKARFVCDKKMTSYYNDGVITQDTLFTDRVPYNNLVPFDSNIGMRKVTQRND